jgi:hypothetical protein
LIVAKAEPSVAPLSREPISGKQPRFVALSFAEPMSTLDAELNDFGAQLAMLRGHAADRDG